MNKTLQSFIRLILGITTLLGLFAVAIPIYANTNPNTIVFTDSGYWTVPDGITNITVKVWGAGGGGGSSNADSGDGAGGGGGGYASKTFDVIPGTNYAVTIGTGGTGGASGATAAGETGGTSSFGDVLSATGGVGGSAASSGVRVGGAGGIGIGGAINYSGHDGESLSEFPQGDGGVPGDVNNNTSLCDSLSYYINKARCREGYQDNNPGDNFGGTAGLDNTIRAGLSGDSAGGSGYTPGNGGAPSRSTADSGTGGNGRVVLSYNVQAIEQVQNPIVSFSASPLSVSYNGSSTISWNSPNATSCVASGGTNNWSGNKNTSDTFYTGALTSTTTFYITCTNSAGSVSNSVTVNVGNQQIQNPTVYLSASPLSVSYNDSSTISWSSSNATSCVASGGTNGWYGNKNTSGTFYTGALTSTTTFYIVCTNITGGSVSDSVTVNVNNQQVQNPTVYLSASPSSIQSGQSSNLYWNSSNTTSCSSSWNGNVGTYSSMLVYPTYTTTYTITCYSYNGQQVSSSATVYVNNVNYDTYYPNNYNQLSVTTNNATNVTSSSATLNGLVSGNNLYTNLYSTAWFTYGTSTNFLSSTTQTSYNSGYSNYSIPISGLAPNTVYYFRLVAQGSQGMVYGNTLSFTTTNDYINNQPVVTLSADDENITYNEATNLRWFTINASSCYASSGSNGWIGTKSIGPGSFYTGSLKETKTYTITCSNNVGSSTDSVTINVRSRTTTVDTSTKPAPNSLVLITSSVDRNQPIIPTLDNTRPRPGDEINYTVSYQNVGTGAITSLTLQISLPQEVSYMFSTPNNPNIFGNTLIFNLGTLKANGQGSVTVRAQVQNNASAGTNLNFPAVLSYINPSGEQQSVNANVSAQVFGAPTNNTSVGANVFGAGFMPTNIFGWLILIILALLLILLGQYIFNPNQLSLFNRNSDHSAGKKSH